MQIAEHSAAFLLYWLPQSFSPYEGGRRMIVVREVLSIDPDLVAHYPLLD
jgi:hypothetical protein